MADTTALKNRIRAAIKANDNQEITGPVLQQTLLDIVDELDLNPELENEAQQRQNGDSTLQQGINTETQQRQEADTTLQDLIDGITENIENGYVYAGIATPSSTPATGKVFYLALTTGTYTNFGNIEVSQGINILKYNGFAWSLDAFIGIDDTPTPNSPKLVKSGGVALILDGIDVSREQTYSGTTWQSTNLITGISIKQGEAFRVKVSSTVPFSRIIVYYNGSTSYRIIDANENIDGIWQDIVAPADIFQLDFYYYGGANATVTLYCQKNGLRGEIEKVDEKVNLFISSGYKQVSQPLCNRPLSALGAVGYTEQNGYLTSNGTYEGTSSYKSKTTEKIACNTGDIFKYKGDGHGGAVSALFYNNGVISSSYQVNSTSDYANITIPANVDSVVFSSFTGISEDVVFELIFVTEVISHIEQDIDNIASISNNNNKVLNGETKSAYSNLPYDTTLLSCSILKSTKFQIKVEVEGGQSPAFSRFIINYNDSTASNKRLMDTTNMSFLGTWMDFVAPDDLVYLGFYTDASHANIRMYLKTFGILQEIGNDSFPLRNKIGVSFGDSIMAGDGNNGVGVLDLLIRDFGCSGQDYAVGGASCAYHEGRGHIVAQIQSYIQNHLSDELDFILLDGLSNDITTSELGELNASFDYVTGGYADYTKGLEYCIGLLTNSFPTIPIIYFIPHSTPARDYDNELSFGNRAREICKKWSIPVADIYLDGCLNARINSQHSQYGDASGTHPNEAGYLHSYIPLISSELIKLLPSD